MRGLLHALVAIPLAARTRSRFTILQAVSEGRKIALDAGQLKDLPVVLVVSATTESQLANRHTNIPDRPSRGQEPPWRPKPSKHFRV